MKSLQQFLRSGDLSASLVVFLVALPLCLGIAMASGMPPSAGLIASIIGGVLVGGLSGSPLQVSGPAAGLTVLMWNLVEQYGVHEVGAIVCVAGVLQMVAGRLGLGRAFQAVSPAVVYGMLAGIGVLLCASQLHVMLDARPYSSGVANLAALPRALGRLFGTDSHATTRAAAGLGGMTIVILISWERLRPRALRAVPPALAGVFLASLAAAFSGARVSYVAVADDMLSTLTLPRWQGTSYGAALVAALSLALVASAETLLCAAAVDRMQQRARTDYNRELFAQGVGNALCGLLGGLPITGVIVRSSANVEAGAQTRLSTMLHGLWMLLLVVLAPGVLRLVPTASLAGVLVYTGVKLVSVAHMRELRSFGWHTLAIYAVTLGLVVGADLLTGVLAGVALSLLKLLWELVHLDAEIEQRAGRVDVHLQGVLTFVGVPRLLSLLEKLPNEGETHLHVERVRLIDHAGLVTLRDYEAQARSRGESVVVDWQHVDARCPGAASAVAAGSAH